METEQRGEDQAEAGAIAVRAARRHHRRSEQQLCSGHVTGKAGVIGFTKQLAAEGAPHRIRVNTISPGVIATPALDRSPKEEMDRVIANVPLGRVGQPEDIAYCALWLASDEGAWVTAQNMVIDGGTSEIK